MNERRTLALAGTLIAVLFAAVIVQRSLMTRGKLSEQSRAGDNRVYVPQAERASRLPSSGSSMLQSSDLSVVDQIDEDCTDLAVAGSVLYAACGSSLNAFDLSNPAEPASLGSYHGQNPLLMFALDETHAYVIDALRHILVIDTTTPSNMSLVSDTAVVLGSPREAVVLGSTLYVVEGPADEAVPTGVRAIDVQNPAGLVQSDIYVLSDVEGRGISVQGDSLYVGTWTAKGTGGLYIFDASQTALRLVSSHIPDGGVTGVAIDGNHAFANVYSRDLGVAELHTVNTSDNLEPYLTGKFDYSPPPSAIVNAGFVAREKTPFLGKLALSNGYAFSIAIFYGLDPSVVDSEPRMRYVLNAIDISNELQPELDASLELDLERVADIVTLGDYVYIAGGNAGILVLHRG